jgi:hypothetical protein
MRNNVYGSALAQCQEIGGAALVSALDWSRSRHRCAHFEHRMLVDNRLRSLPCETERELCSEEEGVLKASPLKSIASLCSGASQRLALRTTASCC